MARQTNAELKEKVVTDWKKGVSQNDLAKMYGISKGTVNNWCKGVSQIIEPLVNAQVKINQELTNLTDRELTAFRNEVEERTKHLMFFTNSALKNQQLANRKLTQDAPITDLEAHSRITARNKETVLGKSPDTAVQINNEQPQEQRTIRILRAGIELNDN